MRLFSVIAAAAAAKCALAADASTWRGHSIYQVMTDRFARTDGSTTATCNTGDGLYCGGTWRGLINKLDYIQNMGFTAVWISPIVENLPQKTKYGYAYHGYWQQNIYALNSHFGTAQDLKDLSAALRQRKMLLMVDIVVNHNGWDGSSSSVDYSVFDPFNKASQYHAYCPVNDYNNQTNVEDCWLGDQNVALVDLRTEDDGVAAEYRTWIGQLVANYSIDGLRIDTARHVDKAFWRPFSQAAGVFGTGEVFDGDPNYVCSYQGALDSVLNYPVWYNLIDAFKSTSGSISNLVNQINSMKSTCQDTTVLGSFSENHDNPRFASLTQDIAQARNVLAFTILADGIPIVYNGQEQHYAGGADPNNREAVWLSGYNTNSDLYRHVAVLNQIRNHAVFSDAGYVTYKNWVIYSDTTTVAMRKGSDGKQIITVLSNKGTNGASYTQSIGNTGYSANEALTEILGCTSLNTDGNGNISVSMGQGAPKVFYPTSQLSGSGICGY